MSVKKSMLLPNVIYADHQNKGHYLSPLIGVLAELHE